LPPTRLQVTEHQIFAARCACGKQHRSVFPATVVAPAQYGPKVLAMSVYLTQHHMLPVARTAQILAAFAGEPIAAATVQNAIFTAAGALGTSVRLIKEAVLNAPILHVDETGLRAMGGMHWLHVPAIADPTLAVVRPKRGADAITELGVLERFRGLLVHDGFVPYKNLVCQHALCNAHRLRELQWEAEQTGQLWSKDLIQLLLIANQEVRQTGSALDPPKLDELKRAYRELLDEGDALNPGKVAPGGRKSRAKQSTATCLLRRLRDYEDEVLRFAEDPAVPFTNNIAERAMRMPKVKRKTSGRFRTIRGVGALGIVRSYLSTLAKQNRDLLGNLVMALQGNAPDPGPA
jgi:transposase